MASEHRVVYVGSNTYREVEGDPHDTLMIRRIYAHQYGGGLVISKEHLRLRPNSAATDRTEWHSINVSWDELTAALSYCTEGEPERRRQIISALEADAVPAVPKEEVK